MRKQFAYHLDRIENIIGKMNARGDDFFEDTIRIGRVFDLMNKDKIKAEFEKKVVGDTEDEIDATVNELIDWMVEQDLRTWEAINGYLDRRRLAQYEDQMVGEVSSQFRYDRRALLDSVSKRAQEEVDRYDPDKSANDLSLSVRNAVAQTAIAEVGAIGLGALVVAAASTVAVDVTGIVAASLLAGFGLFILPRKRKQTREEFRKRSTELEQNLVGVMNEQFEHELQRSVHRMDSAIAPYSRFVRDQHAKLTTTKGELEQIVSDLKGMRFKIGGAEESAPALQAGVRPWSPVEETKPDYRDRAVDQSSANLHPLRRRRRLRTERGDSFRATTRLSQCAATSPCWYASAAAAARLRHSSLARIRPTWWSAVFSVMKSASAIWRLDFPSAISRSTSSSRGVRLPNVCSRLRDPDHRRPRALRSRNGQRFEHRFVQAHA